MTYNRQTDLNGWSAFLKDIIIFCGIYDLKYIFNRIGVNMLIKVRSKHGREHLWGYENFRIEVNAILIDYSLYNDSIINWIIYSVPQEVPLDVFNKYDFDFTIIDANDTHEKNLQKPIISQPEPRRVALKKQINYVHSNCYKCLYWDDDKEKCLKIGKCEFI